jgi:plastocyanin
VLLALSTGHKLGLGLAAVVFIVFALASSFLLPRYRADFPGRRLGAFVAASVLLFVGMMAAVQIFGKESEAEPAEAAETGGAGGAEASGTAPATTSAGNAPGRPIQVTETEFKIRLPGTKLPRGTYVFELKNAGKIPHDLTISGPQVNNAKTAVIDGGKTARLKVTLVPGEYDFYCSVPGHKEAGMDVKVAVA